MEKEEIGKKVKAIKVGREKGGETKRKKSGKYRPPTYWERLRRDVSTHAVAALADISASTTQFYWSGCPIYPANQDALQAELYLSQLFIGRLHCVTSNLIGRYLSVVRGLYM